MSATSVQIAAGSTIGPYVVERKLAQGGMSVLFLGHDTKLDRPVAIKMIAEEMANAASRARLLREARTLASVDHAGIVRIYGAGEHEGTPWIAMELIRGTDLKRVLQERGPVPAMRALRWTIQACDAIAAAHDVGVVHRDLKPSNLLLTHDDQIKIVDFGIAKRRVDQGSGDVLTSQGEVLGTPAYLSPEQLEHGLADERSDVWALGCVLYELCVGTPPFGRGSSAATTAAILRDEPIFPPHLAGAVIDVITACLRKSSFARIGSMRELAALARDALEQPTGPATGAPDRAGADRGDRGSSARAPSMRPSVAPASAGPSAPYSTGSFSPASAAGYASGGLQEVAPRRPSSLSRAVRPSAPPPPPRSSGSIRVPHRGRIKGTAVRTGLLWFAQTYGAGALAKVAELASPDTRVLVRLDEPAFGIVASAWYEAHRVGELLFLMEQVADTEDSDTYNDALAAAIAKDNVNGVYRSLFRLITTPTMLEANAQRVWRTYSDEGTLVVTAPRPGELRCELRQWTHHHPHLCRVVGFVMQHVLRLVNYDGLVLERSQCVTQGDVWCAFDAMYLSR